LAKYESALRGAKYTTQAESKARIDKIEDEFVKRYLENYLGEGQSADKI
jgi:hypothetical protein